VRRPASDRIQVPLLMPIKLKPRDHWVAAFLLAMAIANGIELWRQRVQLFAGYGDFSALYTAGSLVRRGQGKSLYDRREQWRVQQEFAPNVAIRKGPMPYIRPPFEALIFVPFTYFSYPAALAIWSAIKIAFLCLTVCVLPRPSPFTRVYPAWLEVTLCLGLFPVLLDFLQGQDAILLLLIVAATLNRLDAGKDAVGGAILALGLFKFHLVLPIGIVLWLSGRARILAGFLPGSAALVALSCAVSGASVLFTYPAYLLDLNRATGVGVVTAQSMPNLRGLLSAALGRAAYPGPIHWLLLPVAVVAIVVTARLWKPIINTGFRGLALGYCLTLLAAILTSYYVYSYDMTLLIIPLLLLSGPFLAQPSLSRVERRMIAAGFLLLICTPLYWALILQWDRPYLLVIPMFMVALAIVSMMRQARPAPA
jgi:glycosyl transferase family 87